MEVLVNKMTSNTIQNIITLLTEFYGDSINNVAVSAETHTSTSSASSYTSTGTSYCVTPVLYTYWMFNVTAKNSIKLPSCIDILIKEMRYDNSFFYFTFNVPVDIEAFEEKLRKELYAMYSDKFDQIIDKLLS